MRISPVISRPRVSGASIGSRRCPTRRRSRSLVNAAFWASLRREEGYVSKISLAFLSPDQSTHPLLLERPLALDARSLAKVAPVVERAGIHLGVWHEAGELKVWGTTRTIPSFCFVLEVIEPGLLVIKHHGGEVTGKFVNAAVIEGDRIKVVDQWASSLPECPALLKALVEFDSPASRLGSFNVRVQLAVSMRAHGRGGTMLIVPTGSDEWRESIVHPMPYAVVPPQRDLADLMSETESQPAPLAIQDASRQSGGRDGRVDRGRWRHDRQRHLRTARVRRENHPAPRVAARRAREDDRTHRRRRPEDGGCRPSRRDATPVGCPVRARSAGRRRARRLAGPALHDLRLVAARADGTRAPRRVVVAVVWATGNRQPASTSGIRREA